MSNLENLPYDEAEAKFSSFLEARQQEKLASMSDTELETQFRDFRNATYTPSFPYGQIVGGIAGGAAGPVGGVVGSVAGEAIQQGIEVATGSSGAPPDIEESLRRLGEAGAFAGLGEAIAAPSAALKSIGRFHPRIAPRAIGAETERALGFIDERGLPPILLPGEMSGKNLHNFFESVAETGIIPSKKLLDFKTNRNVVTRELAEDIANEMGQRMPPEELGKAIVDAAKGNFITKSATANVHYNTVRAMVRPKTEIIDSADEAGRLVKKQIQTGGVLMDTQSLKLAFPDDAALKTLPNRAQVADMIDYMQALRAEARGLEQGVAVGQAGKTKARDLKQINDEITSTRHEINKALEASGNPNLALASEVWKEGDRIVAGAHAQFNNDTIRALTKTALYSPKGGTEKVMAEILTANDPKVIRSVFDAVGPAEQQSLRALAFRDAFEKAAKEGDPNFIDVFALEKNIYGKGEVGKKAVANALYRPEDQRVLGEYINLLKQYQVKPGGQTSPVFVQMKQVGAVSTVSGAALGALAGTGVALSSAGLAGAVTLVFSPKLLGHLLTQESTRKLMVQGLRYKTDSVAFGRWLTNLAAIDNGVARVVQTALASQRAQFRQDQPASLTQGTPRAFPLEK